MAQDAFHDAVKKGLKKDGWKIMKEQFRLRTGGVEMYVDITADRLITAEKDDNEIAVEVKTFMQPSDIYEFHLAIGQIRNYQLALSKEQSQRTLYLAVPDDTYDRFFTLSFVQEAIKYNDVHLLVYNVDNEEVVLWIK